MRKQEFLNKLRAKLYGLPQSDIDERVSFYKEMIDDRMEEGRSEEDAVSDIGAVDEIAAQIRLEIAPQKKTRHTGDGKPRTQAWVIVLLVLGAPIWLSLAVAAFSVAISLFAVLWSLVISLWAVFAALAVSGVGGVLVGVIFALCGNTLPGIAVIGAALLCAGLSILLFFGCTLATRGMISLTKKIALGVKGLFVGKEKMQ